MRGIKLLAKLRRKKVFDEVEFDAQNLAISFHDCCRKRHEHRRKIVHGALPAVELKWILSRALRLTTLSVFGRLLVLVDE